MDINNNSEMNNRMYRRPTSNAMATASIIMGILGILTMSTGIFSIFFGALGIIFYLLSDYKTADPGLRKYLGLILCCVSLVIGIAMVVYTIVSLPTLLADPAYRRQLDDMFEQLYGMDFQTFYDTYMNF